ncbi:MAG TPA: iron-containing redox enzyme family protein [Pyrinomonadaceae bacterium]|jgi:hypothetical protein|nr:iron-containing redox enzyme family protein [Pyrinomonadaceae bacterium]
MTNLERLAGGVERVLSEEVGRIFAEVPYAGHLTGGDDLDDAYYLRHRVETIRRIRMTSKTDALALFHMVGEDYDAARRWAHYTAQELNHDLLYMKDLRRHGMTDEAVAAVEPFASTAAMVDYLLIMINLTGALPAVAYSLFVEWNSARGSARVVEKAERKYSGAHVAGSRAHVGIDDDQDHYAMVLDIAHRLLARGGGGEEQLFGLLREIAGFFRVYFKELYEHTIARRDRESAVIAV